jgi:DnaJ-class molecular chaperone
MKIISLYKNDISQFTLELGFVQTIKGEGMPAFENFHHGDLFVEYNVVLPSDLTPDLRHSTSPTLSQQNCNEVNSFDRTSGSIPYPKSTIRRIIDNTLYYTCFPDN